jgi:hypothetical protein
MVRTVNSGRVSGSAPGYDRHWRCDRSGLFVGSGAVMAEVGPTAFITYALTGVLIIGNAFRGLDGEFRQR